MQHLLARSAIESRTVPEEFRVGVRSLPYLADHGFQDMVVLPGSFFVEMALSVSRALHGRARCTVRNVTFQNPIMLSAQEDAVIRRDVRDDGSGRVGYAFYEAGAEPASGCPGTRRYAAALNVDVIPSPDAGCRADAFSIDAFQAQADFAIGAEDFYKRLRENGNQYGPSFQHISSIWRAGNQSLGKLAVRRQDTDIESYPLHARLLDSMTQLLAPFLMERGATFILRSIEKVDVWDVAFPETLWGHATLVNEGGEEECVGHVRVFDESGKLYVELSGVAFSFLEPADGADGTTAAHLVIGSNFTAEPVEDALMFWADHWSLPVRLEFAPYNQIFQLLLDPESAFRKNRHGVNIVLLGLEEWAGPDDRSSLSLGKDRADECFAGRARCVLPNGLEIVHLNQYETDHVYKEIFEDECYLRHGVCLQDDDVVVDIGANIGLFSLFVLSRCRTPHIYAFEPAPTVYGLLKANCEAYDSTVHTVNCGVSDRPGTATFTFYENSSVFSSFHANETEDRNAIQAVVRNALNREGSVDGDSVEAYVSELTADRLRRSTHHCRMTSVSQIIREHQLDRIDILKIDAEKSELDIIEGIEDGDWPKISQIVVEIHDRTREAVRRVEDRLSRKGFRCAVDHDTRLEHSGLFTLYATREEGRRTNPDTAPFEQAAARPSHTATKAEGLQRQIREFTAALRSFMNQSAVPLILCLCPRTPAAQADVELSAALDDAEQMVLAATGSMANVHTIEPASSLGNYSITEYYDVHSHRLAHIPYTPECYAAIGTTLVRTLFNLTRAPRKVIALDCDNTLWKGICGEDGPQGIEVSAPHHSLQEFMIRQMNGGMLLCLCSKNNEQDVLDVIDQRTDMPLKREHLVAWRINWNSKSENIRSLANELNLGLDSFIFVDDNPVDCADVKFNCPEVLTLRLPRDTESLPSFLNHVWALDHGGRTDEDHDRTRMYQERARRQQFLEHASSLKDFIAGLHLRIEIAPVTDAQLDRVSQLTFRTNQFNFTTIRRSPWDIQKFLMGEHARCLVVHVADRFGDYGLVGAVMYEAATDRYKVDTFLLSCRVLGRGVEHAVIADLSRRAMSEERRLIEFTYLRTDKNRPAAEFITSIGGWYRNEASTSWTFPAERLAILSYSPEGPEETTRMGHEALPACRPAPRTSPPAWGFSATNQSDRLQQIGESLRDIDRLAQAIEQHRLTKQPPDADGDVTSDSTLETALANIWTKVLGRRRIGRNENFFEVGGTSLRAVQVIARIRQELNRTLSIVTLFECPTVALLAAKLAGTCGDLSAGTTATDAALRGQRRRHNTMSRHVS